MHLIANVPPAHQRIYRGFEKREVAELRLSCVQAQRAGLEEGAAGPGRHRSEVPRSKPHTVSNFLKRNEVAPLPPRPARRSRRQELPGPAPLHCSAFLGPYLKGQGITITGLGRPCRAHPRFSLSTASRTACDLWHILITDKIGLQHRRGCRLPYLFPALDGRSILALPSRNPIVDGRPRR